MNDNNWESELEDLMWAMTAEDGKGFDNITQVQKLVRNLIADEREKAVSEYQLKMMGK
jgi:hypothetical protein